MTRTLARSAVVALIAALVVPAGVARAATGDPLVFHEVTPCAVFDTRPSQGGTGALAAGEARTFHVVGSTSNFAGQGGVAGGCGIPGFSGGSPQTEMVYLNLVAVDPAGGGNLRVWATDKSEPAGGVVNYQKLVPNLNNSNSVVVGVRQDSEGSDITVRANVSGTHVRGVALGYLTTAEASAWLLGGNGGTNPATDFVGTTDNEALNFRVNGEGAFRLEPAAVANVVGGWSGNSTRAGVRGATIGGGGCPASPCSSALPNRVTDNFGTVGGGTGNTAGDASGNDFATVGGGVSNTASGFSATVGGGRFNAAGGSDATVGGGSSNTAGGDSATVGGGRGNTASVADATVGGGGFNTASGFAATVGGGDDNTASGVATTIPGGMNNTASGFAATVPGGELSVAAGNYSYAAGRRAKANHAGAFVWGDSQNVDFASTMTDQFNVRAANGARVITAGNWNIGDTNGDLFLGTATHSLRMGVATAGGGAGDAYIGSVGGTNRLFLVSGHHDTRALMVDGPNVHVFGTLTKAAGSFLIDHPLDPANRYLSHSFVESPDMKNIYDGVVRTGSRGRALVRLPDYFTSLNADYRYQLTVIGTFARAIVAQEIEGNRFTIRTSKPNVRVSWQVTGIRQDPYAVAHPIEVEQRKPQGERGTYLFEGYEHEGGDG